MGNSEIEAKKISQSEKSEYQDVERELYIAPVDIYDDEDVGGTIKQTGESSFEISLSKDEVVEGNEDKESKHPVLDKVHGFLDVAGFIPALGAVPDIANGIIYLCQGDFTNMGLSFVAAVPVYGDTIAGVTKGAKYVGKGIKAAKENKVVAANIKRIECLDVDKQAEIIVEMAKKNDIKKISLLWTNGTKFNTKAVVRKVESMNPELKIRAFETTIEGIQMEKTVNRKLVEEGIRRGYSKEELFKLLKQDKLWAEIAETGNKSFKQSLEAYQRRQSTLYAKRIKRDDYLLKFKRYGRSDGQASVVEKKVLDKAKREIDIHNVPDNEVLHRIMTPSGSTKIVPLE